MKKFILLSISIIIANFFDACKEKETDPGKKLSGRLLEDCNNPVGLSGKVLEIWEEKRMLSANDSIPEKFISAVQTDEGGFFVFNYDFDSVPMSLRLKADNGEYVQLARGIFGWHNYINTFNSIVADVLQKGNSADFVFNLHLPGGWFNGDSVVFSINSPHMKDGYKHIYRFGENMNDTVRNVRAFTRIMDNQLNPTPLDRKFSFPVQAEFYLSGSKISKNYWIPTITCPGDSLHLFRIQL